MIFVLGLFDLIDFWPVLTSIGWFVFWIGTRIAPIYDFKIMPWLKILFKNLLVLTIFGGTIILSYVALVTAFIWILLVQMLGALTEFGLLLIPVVCILLIEKVSRGVQRKIIVKWILTMMKVHNTNEVELDGHEAIRSFPLSRNKEGKAEDCGFENLKIALLTPLEHLGFMVSIKKDKNERIESITVSISRYSLLIRSLTF